MAKPSEKSKPAKEAKVFDVAKPGKAAPSATAKPVIVTNRPILQDPMMKDDSQAASEPTPLVAPSKTTIQIKPIHISDDGEMRPDADQPASAPAEPVADKPVDEPAEPAAADTAPVVPEVATEAAAPKTAETPKAPETPPNDATPAKTAPAPDQPDKISEPSAPGADDTAPEPTDPKADEVAARQQAERDAELEKLVESRKYNLPINQVEKRRNKRVAILGLLLIIILIAAWADIALDAGIIKIAGVKPLTHFFNK